jgi:hypothetical protein
VKDEGERAERAQETGKHTEQGKKAKEGHGKERRREPEKEPESAAGGLRLVDKHQEQTESVREVQGESVMEKNWRFSDEVKWQRAGHANPGLHIWVGSGSRGSGMEIPQGISARDLWIRPAQAQTF